MLQVALRNFFFGFISFFQLLVFTGTCDIALMSECTNFNAKCPEDFLLNPLSLVACIMKNAKMQKCKPCACHAVMKTVQTLKDEKKDATLEIGNVDLPCDDANVSVYPSLPYNAIQFFCSLSKKIVKILV